MTTFPGHQGIAAFGLEAVCILTSICFPGNRGQANCMEPVSQEKMSLLYLLRSLV